MDPAGITLRPGLRRLITATAFLWVASCSTPHPVRPQTSALTLGRKFIFQRIQEDLAQNWSLYQLVPSRTHILVYAYRGGVLAPFGHDHVIEVTHEQGLWLTDGEKGQGWLCFPLDAMRVDVPALRRESGPGFRSPITSVETRATRRHMLQSLDTQRYPDVVLSVTNARLKGASWILRIRLHGVTQTFPKPVRYEPSPRSVHARVRLTLMQSRFGIHPYSILAGALRVRDALRLKGQVDAKRVLDRKMTDANFLAHWCTGRST